MGLIISGEVTEILKNPLYISSPKDFLKIFYDNEEKIPAAALNIMELSIERQKEREKEVYDALDISEDDWEKLSDIVGGFIQDNSDGVSKNHLDFILNQFRDYILTGIFEGIRINKTAEAKKLESSDSQKFNNILKKYVNFYNQPVKEFKEWYDSKFQNNQILQGYIKPEDISFLNKILEKQREADKKKNKAIVNKDGTINYNYLLTQSTAANEFLGKSQGVISNFFGGFKEGVLLAVAQNVEQIIKLGTTSYWAEQNSGKKITFMRDLVQKNEIYYKGDGREIKGIQTEINEYLEKNQIKIDTPDGYFDFEDSVSKNLKADDIFYLEIKGEIKPFGISSKASWTETSDKSKLMGTSYKNVFINMLKGMFSEMSTTIDISNFIKYSTYNALAHYNIDNGEYKAVYNKVKKMFDKVISYYAYIWLMGGDSEYTHADFFSIYKAADKRYYFIPMSKILAIIKEEPNYISESGLFPLATDKVDDKGEILRKGRALNENQISAFKNGTIVEKKIPYRNLQRSMLDEILEDTSGDIFLNKFSEIKTKIISGH